MRVWGVGPVACNGFEQRRGACIIVAIEFESGEISCASRDCGRSIAALSVEVVASSNARRCLKNFTPGADWNRKIIWIAAVPAKCLCLRRRGRCGEKRLTVERVAATDKSGFKRQAPDNCFTALGSLPQRTSVNPPESGIGGIAVAQDAVNSPSAREKPDRTDQRGSQDVGTLYHRH